MAAAERRSSGEAAVAEVLSAARGLLEYAEGDALPHDAGTQAVVARARAQLDVAFPALHAAAADLDSGATADDGHRQQLLARRAALAAEIDDVDSILKARLDALRQFATRFDVLGAAAGADARK